MENSLKPKEHNIKLNNKEIFRWFTRTKQKAHGKPRLNFTQPKMYKKSPKNRQMPIKHNKTSTCGVISTLKGG